MQQPIEMTTLSQVLEKLRQKGIESEIKLNGEKQMASEQLGKTYEPEDLLIIKTFRFEGDSDPADNSVLYIVEDTQGKISYILDAYGAYSDHEGPEFDDFIKRIPTDEREHQELFS
jgi:hypothetical protein